MSKNVNIHIKTKGTDRARREIDKTSDSVKDVGKSAEKSGRSFGGFAKSIASWVSAAVGITAVLRGIKKALDVNARAMEEHAEIAAQHQRKLLALQGMGDFFQRHPEARKEVAYYAQLGKRPYEEVAEAWYSLESKSAGLSEKQKAGIMQEASELGRMEPDSDLKSIIEMFSLYAKETGETDINKVQNVIRQTMDKAGANLSQVAQYMPEFLPMGLAAGMTGAEAAGLWAYATTRTKDPSRATVAMRNIFMALQGRGTPESQEMLDSVGIDEDMEFQRQIEVLSKRAEQGRFGLSEAETLAGKENAALLLSMLRQPQAMNRTVESVAAVDRADIDITRDRLKKIMEGDEVAMLEERRRELDVMIENQKGNDIDALRWDVHLKELEHRLREHGREEYEIALRLWGEKQKRNWGWDPGEFDKYNKGVDLMREDPPREDPPLLGPRRDPNDVPADPNNTNEPVVINYVQNHIFQPTYGTDPVDMGIGDRAFSD